MGKHSVRVRNGSKKMKYWPKVKSTAAPRFYPLMFASKHEWPRKGHLLRNCSLFSFLSAICESEGESRLHVCVSMCVHGCLNMCLMCVRVCAHVCLCLCFLIYVYMSLNVCKHAFEWLFVNSSPENWPPWQHAFELMCLYVRIDVCIWLCVYLCLDACVDVCVVMCVWLGVYACAGAYEFL